MIKDAISDIFGINVFDDEKQKKFLKEDVYLSLKKTIEENGELDRSIADEVAEGMKNWAISRGATHFCHWFQPLNGITAEKHESFIDPIGDGKVIMSFSGKELLKGEPDASSFPSGGIRATFEARGYTSWDCTSPAFLKEDESGLLLCIPTVFCSYTGEALDKKTPLLRSSAALDKQVKRILKLFGNDKVKKVECSVGAEQEYFLVDHDKYMAREDLIFTRRTLFGRPAPKGQEMDDHYFGAINERVSKYMREVNNELWKLGINAKAEHNEVAPHQHELAPVYTKVNVATDQNQLTMEVMKKVAKHHHFECLLHEKPFAGVNGSGKHNNWSISTDDGKNLLEPGSTPHENAQFLLFLSAVIKAVDENALLLRLSASSPGNDHRLGADEAPPAIISIFLGDQLSDIVRQIIKNGAASTSKFSSKLDIGVHTLPPIARDNTDRNRTSPFAFTGNKFEFRMLGSSLSIAEVNTTLNVCVAKVLKEYADYLEKANDFTKALRKVIRNTLVKHQRIIFDGNGYSKEWIEEAARRGLPNAKTYIDAISALTDEQTIKMYADFKVLSEDELRSRAEVDYKEYTNTINIEANTMIDMVNRQYLPSVLKYLKDLSSSYNEMKNADLSLNINSLKGRIIYLNDLYNKTAIKLDELINERLKVSKLDGIEQAFAYRDNIVPIMKDLRALVDEMEGIVDANYWPVPTYASLLYDN